MGTVNAAYTLFSNTASPSFRAGRTFTSVQHRALKYDTAANKKLNGTNYLDLPTKTTFTGAINGEIAGINSTTAATTTAAKQDALVNDNYVDFTIDSGFADDDGGPNAISAFTYIQASCAAVPTIKTDAIRLRQTGQESGSQKEIKIPGFAIGTP